MIRYRIILLIISFCILLVLGVSYKFTHSKSQAQMVTEEKNALFEIFPDADEFKGGLIEGINYYLARKNNRDLGYIIKAETKGYSGLISMLVSFDFKGEIKGIKILSQTETPFLGAKINEIRSGEKKPWFLRQFEGKIAQDLELKKNIDTITAATISSRAVLEGIKKSVLDFLAKVKEDTRQ